jgi:hypothetical protein
MAMPGQETMACEEWEGMANNGMYLPSSSVAVAMDQSKLPKDNGSQLLPKDVGHNGPDQSNDNNGCNWMGGGMTQMVLQLRKATCIGGSKTRTTIKLDCNTMHQ